jgi:hypothetical protein
VPTQSLSELVQQEQRVSSPMPRNGVIFDNFYCKKFSSSLKTCDDLVQRRDISVQTYELVRLAPLPAEHQVTLILASSTPSDIYSGVLAESMKSFEGDQVYALLICASIVIQISYCDIMLPLNVTSTGNFTGICN